MFVYVRPEIFHHKTSVGIPTEVKLKKKNTTAQTEEMRRIWYPNEVNGEISKSDVII